MYALLFALFNPVIDFLDEIDPVIKDNLKQQIIEIVCLTDIFEKMINVKLKLPENKMNFTKAEEISLSFIVKFDFYKTNINR